jgi:hypothetical protein
MLLSNCTFDRGSLSPTFIKPFDLFAKSAETGDWLLRLDSNRQPSGYTAARDEAAITEVPRKLVYQLLPDRGREGVPHRPRVCITSCSKNCSSTPAFTSLLRINRKNLGGKSPSGNQNDTRKCHFRPFGAKTVELLRKFAKIESWRREWDSNPPLHTLSKQIAVLKGRTSTARPAGLRGYADSGSPAVIRLDSCARLALMAV